MEKCLQCAAKKKKEKNTLLSYLTVLGAVFMQVTLIMYILPCTQLQAQWTDHWEPFVSSSWTLSCHMINLIQSELAKSCIIPSSDNALYSQTHTIINYLRHNMFSHSCNLLIFFPWIKVIIFFIIKFVNLTNEWNQIEMVEQLNMCYKICPRSWVIHCRWDLRLVSCSWEQFWLRNTILIIESLKIYTYLFNYLFTLLSFRHAVMLSRSPEVSVKSWLNQWCHRQKCKNGWHFNILLSAFKFAILTFSR